MLKDLNSSEIQLISTLNWFRSRYALYNGLDINRKSTKENIEESGHIWIGDFKDNWTDAFSSLIEKKVLELKENEYFFTEKGLQIKDYIEKETPFYKFEYDYYFYLEQNSKAHQKFCKKVYGKNLSQHGLINLEELELLINKLRTNNYKNILDIGCGNGRITEYLSTFCDSNFLGVDISSQAIEIASNRTKDNQKLNFQTGNFNNLNLQLKSFDMIISLDTLYYTNDIKKLISDILNNLKNNGEICVYYSQWIGSLEDSDYLYGDNTVLARSLKDLDLNFKFTDLTTSGLKHWKLKFKVLEDMRDEFLKEDTMDLWKYRYGEAHRYAHWGDDKYTRYFYEINAK